MNSLMRRMAYRSVNKRSAGMLCMLCIRISLNRKSPQWHKSSQAMEWIYYDKINVPQLYIDITLYRLWRTKRHLRWGVWTWIGHRIPTKDNHLPDKLRPALRRWMKVEGTRRPPCVQVAIIVPAALRVFFGEATSGRRDQYIDPWASELKIHFIHINTGYS